MIIWAAKFVITVLLVGNVSGPVGPLVYKQEFDTKAACETFRNGPEFKTALDKLLVYVRDPANGGDPTITVAETACEAAPAAE